jgi:hypothetical protein
VPARCKQPPDVACETSGGWQLIGVHADRRDAVAKMGDDERITTYARHKAEQEQRRAEAEADRFYADPVKVAALHAGWAAQREAMAAVNAELRAEEGEMRARCRDPWIHLNNCQCRDPDWVPPPLPAPQPRGVAPVADLAAERARRTR